MKKSFLFMFVAVVLSGASASLMAQEPRGTTATAGTFVMSEFAEKPVKGAPYSAESVTETRQRLADGNEIVNKSEATVYRDTQGRTRREQNIKMIGGLAGAAPVQLITISDPVAGATYTLDPATKTARKGYFNSFFLSSSGGASPSISVNGGGATAITLNRTEVAGGSGGSFSTASGGRVATTSDDRVSLLKQSLDNVKREDLGTQTIEGVEATGTRNTMTIAAGEIGNERPIDVVTERWYSKELQTTVMSRRSDPRSGETIFRLTNINRNEPAGSLFEVPSDYKLTETGGGSIRVKQ
jgi:TolA-binding protein